VAQLYFYYSSTALLQSAYNYQERGMNPFILSAALDDRYGIGKVTSRIGLAADARLFNNTDDLRSILQAEHLKAHLDCVLIDESQFLSREQVKQLTQVVDHLHIPILCYGIRTDFRGELFPGSQYLLAWADKLVELKTVCHCGRKATMVVRTDEHGTVIKDGEQVVIGGNDLYQSLCRRHFSEKMWSDK
jgi:thymidine kinase